MKTLIILMASIVPLVAADVQDNVRAAKEITVLVTRESLAPGGRGTGIALDATHVLTCAHMGRAYTDEFFIYTYPLGFVTVGRPIAVDVNNDLLILELEAPMPIKTFAKFEAHTYDGEHITVIGNALGGMKWLVSVGIISGMDGLSLLTDARINHGNSGGPWIDDDGYVVALSDFMVLPKEGPGVSGGISSQTILGFLARVKKGA